MSLSYTWEQDFYLTTVKIPIKEDNKDNKNIQVKFSPKYLSITIGDESLEGELFMHIIAEESSWYLDDGVLIIELAKRETRDFNGLWGKCFTFEEKNIMEDPKWVQPKRPLRECSGEVYKLTLENMKKFEETVVLPK